MTNPYSPPPDHTAAETLHPDWKWMSAMAYGMCLLYLLAVPESSVDPRVDAESRTGTNFLYLLAAIAVAASHASLYRGN